MIDIEKVQKAKPMLSLSKVLSTAFQKKKDAARVRTKIDRGTPELTKDEAKAIEVSLASRGIKIGE